MKDSPVQTEDDSELDISDDPVLSALNKDLESVLSFTDNGLIVFLVVVFAIAYFLEYLKVPSVALFTIVVICIFGGIGYTVYSVVRGKQRVAARYGLICDACGHRPRVGQIMLVAQTELCPVCGNKLDFHKP